VATRDNEFPTTHKPKKPPTPMDTTHQSNSHNRGPTFVANRCT
jgi:hypothetical protein